MGRLLSVAIFVTAVAAAIVIAGGGVDVPPKKQSVTAAAVPAPAPRAKGDHGGQAIAATVTMRALAFTPATVSATPGEVVRFRNDDDVAHVVFVQPPGESSAAPIASSRRLPPGGTFRVTIGGTGVFPFACTLHPTVMVGRIVSRQRA